MSTPNRQSSKNLFKVSHWMTKLIGIIGFIVFIFFAFVSYNPAQIIGTVILLLFAVWAAYLFIAYGSTEMDEQKITHIMVWGV